MTNKYEEFTNEVKASLSSLSLIKLVLSGKRTSSSELKGIVATIVKLKKGINLNLVYRYATKDITKNYGFDEGIELVAQALRESFNNANLFTAHQDVSLVETPKGKVIIRRGAASLEPKGTFAHDRVKDRAIGATGSTYLHQLGVTNHKGEVRHEMNDKYRQINRYVELLKPLLQNLQPNKKLNIVDMGSGKGYLTFALYDYLTSTLNRDVEMTGVEFRPDLIDTCNGIAQDSGFKTLRFVQGTIETAPVEAIDILIALHACDTATDEAIYRGIRANALLIVCAPCCHKQVRQAMRVTNVLKHVVQHGILKERQAEIVTDSLRALIMEANGYSTKVFEFIDSEHTPKNLMIVGSRMATPPLNRDEILSSINEIKAMYGIGQHHLEVLLGGA
jgi:SAM-dependent methyltransferase